MLIFLFLISLHSTLFSNTASMEKTAYRFKKIGIEQGLSQTSIRSIVQDSRGYMWFGTATGLNRYDGYEFVVYVNDINDSLSISDNEITSLFEDDKGYLWIGTSKGTLNKFDPGSETFIHYDIAKSSDWYSTSDVKFYSLPLSFSRNQNSSITAITQDKSGNLWVGTWGKGIVKFNYETGKKKFYYHFKNKKNSLSSNKIVEILFDDDNLLWVGTFGGGLNRIKFDFNDKEEVIIESYKSDSKYLFGDKITSLFEDSDYNIWIGSYGGGVSRITNEEKHKIPSNTKYDIITTDFKSLSESKLLNVMSITEDLNSIIWIGTYGDGLYSYSKKSKKSEHIVVEVNDPNSLSENEIQSLYIDNSGILWIGTELGSGINKLETHENKFNTIPVLTEDKKSLNDNIVWAIHEDNENNIWIGTHRGGLNKWNRNSNEFSSYRKNQNLADDHIRSIEDDKFGNLWIGSYSGGLSYFDKKKSAFRNFSNDENNPTSINSNQIQSLYNDGDSILWIGTFGGGLNKLNLLKFSNSGIAEFTSYTHNPVDINSISDNRVYTIIKDSTSILWIGTFGGGLNKFLPDSEIFVRYKSIPNNKNSLSDNRIMTIRETHNGNLLIGTFGGGLDFYDRARDRFESISEKISLNCSDIYGILHVDGNGFWLSTDNGIFKLDKELKSFRQYDLSDGLQSLEFSGGAYLIGKDGTCYFGGIKGVNYFEPMEIKLDNFIAPIVISRIKVFEKPIKGEKKRLVFEKDENYFSFEFASLDYKNSGKNKYKFILEGLDTKWSLTDANERRVFYANLNPGDYTFRVNGTNNDGIWSPQEASVEITILEPFWMRWWFIAGLILFIGGVVTFYINQRIRFLVTLDSIKSNIAADLHDNVGAGLTEISILSELATNEIDKPSNASKHIGQISELSRQLVESMSDIVWVVNPNRDSLYDLIVRFKDTYGELLTDLGIKLKTTNLDKLITIKLSMDYRQNLYLILKESLNNCIKHSNCKNIDLVVDVAKNNLLIQLIDNGIGFNLESVTLGNGLKNIQKRGKKIGGNVKITSTKEVGTIIEFEGKLK